jgi:hypothetical protein
VAKPQQQPKAATQSKPAAAAKAPVAKVAQPIKSQQPAAAAKPAPKPVEVDLLSDAVSATARRGAAVPRMTCAVSSPISTPLRPQRPDRAAPHS